MVSERTTKLPIRVGVIGLGFAGQTHLQAYRRLPEVEITALAGLEADKLAQLGETYHIPHLYSDYDELLAREDLDAVSICVPNHLHAPIAVKALRQGKHVICEKPLARTAKETEEMVQVASEAGLLLSVVFNLRTRADVQALKEYITAGTFGQIYYIKASWMRRKGIPMMGSWFVNKEMAGGGALIDIGTHILDLALYLLNEPEILTVSATTSAILGKQDTSRSQSGWKAQKYFVNSQFEVEDLAIAFLRLAGETTLCLEACWAIQSDADDDWHLTFYGTQGGAKLTVANYGQASISQNSLVIFTDMLGKSVEIIPHIVTVKEAGHQIAIQEFVAAITSGHWTQQISYEALTRSRIIDACYLSAAQQKEVHMRNEV